MACPLQGRRTSLPCSIRQGEDHTFPQRAFGGKAKRAAHPTQVWAVVSSVHTLAFWAGLTVGWILWGF